MGEESGARSQESGARSLRFARLVAFSRVSSKESNWIVRRLVSFRHAGRGLWLLISTQWNFRIHLLAAAIAIGLAVFFELTEFEWLILTVTIALVLVAEAVNTSLERLVDLHQPEIHPLARDAKDLAAAVVLITAVGALIVGILLFGPRLWHLLAPGS
jgi:diacylglycerol kinase (ATP)